jgi:PTS system nitrogen regulatory IIA component
MKLKKQQIAHCLQLPIDTIERWIRQGRIPIQQEGDEFTFHRTTLEKWASTHDIPFDLSKNTEYQQATQRQQSLLQVMRAGGVHYGLAGHDVATVLEAACKQVHQLSPEQQDKLYQHLLEREKLTSTGLGNGIAIPHPRAPLTPTLAEPLIVTVFLQKPVDFDAIDDEPVFVLFLLISETVKTHLHLLSRLAYCLRKKQFIRHLQTVPSAPDLWEQVQKLEQKLDKSTSS